MSALLNRSMLYVLVSVVLLAGYVALVMWYMAQRAGATNSVERFLPEPQEGPAADADINASIIRAFNETIKRFPTPVELKDTREAVKALGTGSASSLSDTVAQYVKKNFAGSGSGSGPPAPAPAPAPPAPPAAALARAPATEAMLLQKVKDMAQKLEDLERAPQSSSQPADRSTELLVSMLSDIDRRLQALASKKS